MHLKRADLPDLKQEEKKLSETYKYQLITLLKFVKKLRFKSIYVLIDRADETEKTGNNPEATYRLIQPIIKDLDLLSLSGFGFKFFLWDKIEPYYRNDARPDRITQYKLNWTSKSLVDVLSRRLKAFSQGRISSIQSLMSEQLTLNIDEALCVMSNKSPRNMIRMCEQILAIQANRSGESSAIDIQSVDIGVTNFSETLFKELYGEVSLREIQKVGRELFTTNFIANDVLKISGQGARNKITVWVQSGLVAQIGTVTIPQSRKPVNFYCVVDPGAVRLMYRTTDFVKFIQDRWLPCNHCKSDNLINIDLYPDKNEAVCRECGRNLI